MLQGLGVKGKELEQLPYPVKEDSIQAHLRTHRQFVQQ
jgi:hypothetical protein